MHRHFDAVVDHNRVYVGDGESVKIYSYDAICDSWSRLLDCVYESSTITVIKGWLTTIGGY